MASISSAEGTQVDSGHSVRESEGEQVVRVRPGPSVAAVGEDEDIEQHRRRPSQAERPTSDRPLAERPRRDDQRGIGCSPTPARYAPTRRR